VGRRGGPRGPYRLGDEDDEVPARITARGRVLDAMLVRLETDTRVRAAALVGETFGMDPVVVAEETSPLKRLFRIAAHNIVQSEHRKAQDRAGTSS
jgi:hypothetical protein